MIYAELAILYLLLKIYTQTIQFLNKLLAFVSLQAHAPINCDNFSKISVQLPPIVTP